MIFHLQNQPERHIDQLVKPASGDVRHRIEINVQHQKFGIPGGRNNNVGFFIDV